MTAEVPNEFIVHVAEDQQFEKDTFKVFTVLVFRSNPPSTKKLMSWIGVNKRIGEVFVMPYREHGRYFKDSIKLE